MLLIFFITGLIIGSFLNVVVYRIRIAEDVMGRSYCPNCKHKIHWYDNIPLISFIFLRAKCRSCDNKISWQYPLIEFFTGIIFALTANYFLIAGNITSYWETLFYLIVFSLLLVLLTYDWKFMEVPIIIFWIILFIVIVYFGISDWMSLKKGVDIYSLRIISGLIGGFTAWIFFFSMVFFSKEKWMGWGDVYIGSLVGFILGWPNIFLGLLLSFTIGAIYAIIIMIIGDKNMKSQIPFIPFLAIGTIMTVFIYEIFPSVGYYLYF